MEDALVSAGPAASVIVVGAGQAGLSVAYHLRRRGLVPGADLLILDRGPGAGGAWQNRWESLRLGTAHRVSDLPGMSELGLSFETADRDRPAREVVARYYDDYERHFGLDVRRPIEVERVADAGDRGVDGPLRLDWAGGSATARVLVWASGTWGAPYVPRYPGMDRFLGRQLHTSTYLRASDLAGDRVLVVGGGTSAVGFLLELEGVARSLVWATRRPVEFSEGSTLGLEAGLRAVAEQDAAARAGRPLPSIVSGTGIPVTGRISAGIQRGLLVPRPMFVRIEEHGVLWPDGTRSEVDTILWATGFRPELRALAPLRLREPGGGIRVADGQSSRDPRVFLAGYGPGASTIGANRAGRVIARGVLARL